MAAESGFHRIGRALANPNYGTYTLGSAVSLVGTWMQRVAVGWLAWELTESGAWLGLLAFADLFPTVLVGPLAGAWADRGDRLWLVKVSQVLGLLQALALLALTVSGLITIELLLALTLFLGIVAAANQPARMAMIPQLVRPEDMPAAVAINATIFNAARLVGPAVAGALIVSVGVAGAFAANALTFVVFIYALSRLRVPSAERAEADRRAPIFGDVASGFRYALGHAGIAPALLLLTAVSLGVRPFVELLPGFAGEVFQAGAPGLALLTATVGFGAVIGGLWLARRGPTRGLVEVVLVSCLVLGLAMLVFAASDSLWVAVPALTVAGICLVIQGVGTQTLLQFAVAPEMRGRVLSLYGLILRGGPALGALAMGAASEFVGLGWPLAVGTLAMLLVWALLRLRRRALGAALEGATRAGTGR